MVITKLLSRSFTLRVTPRSWQPHLPVPLKYQLLKAGKGKEIFQETREYMPTARPIRIPEARMSDLPLKINSPLKVMVFIPTYDSLEYITERIKSVMRQCRGFPAGWGFEVMVVVNGANQNRLWEHLIKFRKREGISDCLTLAFIPREKNPGMVQSKTNPLNVALDYARAGHFDVFCCVDDDVELSPRNLQMGIEFLRRITLEKNGPVMVGPEMRLAEPRTWFEKVCFTSGHRNRSVKGCNMFLWTAAIPDIPVDAGNEDFLLKVLYGDRSIVYHAEDVFFVYRFASSFTGFLRQFIRFKWNDSAAEQYLGDRFSLWGFLTDPIIQLFAARAPFSKQGACRFFVRAINLYAVYHVRASILVRNIFDLPRRTVDWVGTVDKDSKAS